MGVLGIINSKRRAIFITFADKNIDKTLRQQNSIKRKEKETWHLITTGSLSLWSRNCLKKNLMKCCTVH